MSPEQPRSTENSPSASPGAAPVPSGQPDRVQELLDGLALQASGARTSEDISTGHSLWTPHGRVFGGQVIAQSLVAAQATVDPERPAHSLHGYFLRPGRITETLTFSVERIHDGRSFSTRRTQVYQQGVPIFSMIASFQTVDAGIDHQEPAPEGVPAPEDVPSVDDLYGHLAGSDPYVSWIQQRPVDMRHVGSPVYLSVEGARTAHQAVWMRVPGTLPDDPAVHRAVLGYASDYSILEPIYRRHGVSWSTPGLSAASLDHAMWFHRPFRADDWLLYVEDSPSAQGGRGLSTGRFYDRAGVLVASVAQEGMVRVPLDGPGIEA